RMGETVNLKIVLHSTTRTAGRLNLLLNGEPMDLDPETEGLGVLVQLEEGMNPFSVPVTVPRPGPQVWDAVFEPVEGATVDSIVENNVQKAVTFVASEGRVLVVYDQDPGNPGAHLPL